MRQILSSITQPTVSNYLTTDIEPLGSERTCCPGKRNIKLAINDARSIFILCPPPLLALVSYTASTFGHATIVSVIAIEQLIMTAGTYATFSRLART
jgi:hypothetical protein